MSNSSAGLGFHSGQGVNISQNLNSTLFHVEKARFVSKSSAAYEYTCLETPTHAKKNRASRSMSSQVSPEAFGLDQTHIFMKNERGA